MFKEVCFCCGKEIADKKECFRAGDVVFGGQFYCKSCAAEIGIKNGFLAFFQTKLWVLKKYAVIHKEAGDRYNSYLLKIGERHLIEQKRASLKEKTQDKYTCISCQNVWFVSDMDKIKNLYNASTGNFYTLNQLKDHSRCPKCGSSATRKETKKYWVDKNGNCVDYET